MSGTIKLDKEQVARVKISSKVFLRSENILHRTVIPGRREMYKTNPAFTWHSHCIVGPFKMVTGKG